MNYSKEQIEEMKFLAETAAKNLNKAVALVNKEILKKDSKKKKKISNVITLNWKVSTDLEQYKNVTDPAKAILDAKEMSVLLLKEVKANSGRLTNKHIFSLLEKKKQFIFAILSGLVGG